METLSQYGDQEMDKVYGTVDLIVYVVSVLA